MTFSPDGRLFATHGTDETVQLWDPATGECLRTLTGHVGRIMAFSPDMRLFVTVSDDPTVLPTGSTVRVWRVDEDAAQEGAPVAPTHAEGDGRALSLTVLARMTVTSGVGKNSVTRGPKGTGPARSS